MQQELHFLRDWRIKESEIELEGEPIGRGAEGDVFRGRLRESGKAVAVKRSKVETTQAVYDEAEGQPIRAFT